MSRSCEHWIKSYLEYTSASEAPTTFHFFSAVFAIAGALRRRVWFDQGLFKWYPNFYIIFVARPGIATKSTSLGQAEQLLRDVPGINFGPSSSTWQALVQRVGASAEEFEIDGAMHAMSCLSFAVSELGALIDFRNRELIDVMVDLWDGRTGAWEKASKMHGIETIVNPWINMIAGVTPSWLSANVPETAVGGGFTSRCIFVYGKEKRHLSAYPRRRMHAGQERLRAELVADLEEISQMAGEFTLTAEAEAYGEEWYRKLWTEAPEHLQGERFEGYRARKQTHLHKLCMVLSAAQRSNRLITLEDFKQGDTLLTAVENDMIVSLDRVGRAKCSLDLEQFMEYINRRKEVRYADAVAFLSNYGTFQEIKAIIETALQAGQITQTQRGSELMIRSIQ